VVGELRRRGCGLPTVYNCSGYELPDSIGVLADSIDIFMPDFKFSSPELAQRVLGAPDYPEMALESLRRMVAAKGFLEPFGADRRSPARTGVLVRHLVLPGNVANSLDLLRVLRHEFGRMLPLSIMSQYRPMPGCRGSGEFERTVTVDEYRQVCALVRQLDFQQVFLQPHFHDTGFVPDFEEEEPFEGNRR
jgi:putative pyruvate formate lyase activating enzyme